MKKEVVIGGRRVPLTFNLAAQIAYEDITGQAFDLRKITTVKARTVLYMACILAADEDTKMTMDDLLNSATNAEVLALDDAVAELIKAWCHIPECARMDEPEEKEKHA